MQTVKRKDGYRYRERVYFNGKSIESPYFRTKSEAKRWKRNTLKERDKMRAMGVNSIDNRTFAQYSESWIKKKSDLETKTIEGYKSVISKYLNQEFGNTKVKNISLNQANIFKSKLIDKSGLSRVRINYIIKVLKMIITDAVKTGALMRDPLMCLDYLRVQTKPRVYWLPREIDQFLLANKDDYYYPLYCFMLNSGVRPTEARALQWDKVDFDSGKVEISRSLDRHGLKETTKSKKTRWIAMNAVVREVLLDLRSKRISMQFVFTQPNGKHIGMHFGDREFYKAVDRAKVRKINFKHLRSTFASNFVMNGGSIFTLSKILGHSSVVITESRYADLHPTFLQKEAEIVSFGAQDRAHIGLVN